MGVKKSVLAGATAGNVGTVVSTTNMGGDAFSELVPTSGNRYVVSGNAEISRTLDATSGSVRAVDASPAGEIGGCLRSFYFPGGTLTGTFTLQNTRSPSDVLMGGACIDSAGRFRTTYGTGNTVATSYSSALAAGWYFSESLVRPETGAGANGEVWANVYDDALNLIWSSPHITGRTHGFLLPGQFRMGGAPSTVGMTVDKMHNLLAWGSVNADQTIASSLGPQPTIHFSGGVYYVANYTGSTPGGGGTLTYTINPTTGVLEPFDGLFEIPQADTESIYTVTVTEGSTSIQQQLVVPAQAVIARTDSIERMFCTTPGTWV